MRILANYGYKTNGDTYSVTFETIGDVAASQAPQTVDDLFRLARQAIHRQLTGTQAQPAVSASVNLQPAQSNGVESKSTAVAPLVNGEGKKPQIKGPTLPATPKQFGLIKRLARQKGQWLGDLGNLTRGEASTKIEELMAL